MMLGKRSQELEILDKGPNDYTDAEYRDCLIKLDRIGRWLGGDQGTLSLLRKNSFGSFLDVGCGGGTFATRVAKQYPKVQVMGIDSNPKAIVFANQQSHPENVRFSLQPLSEFANKSIDIVSSTLVLHHIPDNQLTQFIQECCRVGRKRVIINDLQRSVIALCLFRTISPICFRNRLIQHDGALSIRRSFTYADLVALLKHAGLKKTQYTIRWRWAFRWLIEINCEDV